MRRPSHVPGVWPGLRAPGLQKAPEQASRALPASKCAQTRAQRPSHGPSAPSPSAPAHRYSHPLPHSRRPPRTRTATTPATPLLERPLRPQTRLPLTAVLTHTDYAASAKPPQKRPLNGADLAVVTLDEKPPPDRLADDFDHRCGLSPATDVYHA